MGALQHMAQKHGLVLHMGPKPLGDALIEAHADTEMRAELGRLRRTYFYKGGMGCVDGSCEREVLQLYTTFAFRKQASAISCEQLSACLTHLHSHEGDALRMPCSSCDFVHVGLPKGH